MPLTGAVLKRDDTGAQVGELHKELSELGMVIASDEQSAKKFGDSTVAAIRAFRERHGLPDGETVDATTARLIHVESVFSDVENHAAWRAAVQEAASAADTSQPQELYWLARYAIIAGDYQVAYDLAKKAPDHQGIKDVVLPILNLDGASSPDVPYPENFYTYRYDLISHPLIANRERFRKWNTGPDGETRVPLGLPDPPLAPPVQQAQIAQGELTEAAKSWLEAANQWRRGNEQFEQQRYAGAMAAYEACQWATLQYFEKFYKLRLEPTPAYPDRITKLVALLFQGAANWPFLWTNVQERRNCVSLQELHRLDWNWFSPGAERLLNQPLELLPEAHAMSTAIIRQTELDRPLLILLTVFLPLARAEVNRARRQYQAALVDLSRILQGFKIFLPDQPPKNIAFFCPRIETPFVQLLRAEILLDQADAEYKAQTPATGSPDVTEFQDLKAAQTYLAVKDVFKDKPAYVSNVETAAPSLISAIQERLAVSDTSSREFQMLGKDSYVPTIKSASETLPGLDRRKKAHEPLLEFVLPGAVEVIEETNPRVYAILLTAQAKLEQLKAGFNYLGYLDTYVPPWRFQFLLERTRYFAEHAKNAQREYLNFLSNAEREEFQELSASQSVEMEKSNVRIETARVDQALFEVQAAQQSAALAQLHEENLNKRLIAYTEFDERMDRLFDSDGLKFHLLSAGLASQFPVVAGVGIESPGLGAAIDFGVDLVTGGTASKAKERILASEQRELEKQNLQHAVEEAAKSKEIALTQATAAVMGFVIAGLQRQAALLRHEFALQNLKFLRNRILNAEQWYRLARAIRSISETYLKYAVELAFLAEQAYEFEADKRINVIRFDYDLSEVGDFLAADFLLRDLDTLEKDLILTQRQHQQFVRYVLSMAREFPEALQEIRDNGIAKFSLRLEQLEKRFPGLYNIRIGAVDVLPIALMDSTRFSLELIHLGLSQVRLRAQPDTLLGVPSPSPLNKNDLQPLLFVVSATVFAGELDQGNLSDPFRKHFTDHGVNLPVMIKVTILQREFTWHLSSAETDDKYLIHKKDDNLYVYLLNIDDDWLSDLGDDWPVKIRVTGPETAVFSGLTRQEASAVFPFATANQRQAFESLGAASAWQVDFNARENQVVPGTLADLLITFTLSGYHDPLLREAVDHFKPRLRPRPTVATRWLSARTTFPDALYEFNRSGRMVWKVTRDLLTLTDRLDALRNVAFLLMPRPGQSDYFGRLMSHCEVQINIDEHGELTVLNPIPKVTFCTGDDSNPLLVAVETDADGDISWDFGDGTPRQSGPSQPQEAIKHEYLKPGPYTVTLRVVKGGNLSEFRADVVVSRSHSAHLRLPVTAFPTLERVKEPGVPHGKARIKGTVNTTDNDPVIADWRIAKLPSQKGDTVTFDLQPGDYTLSFTAVRKLKACVYSKQRFNPNAGFDFSVFSLATNRRFRPNGSEITGIEGNPQANLFTDGLFPLVDPAKNQRLALSPVDEWTVEIPLSDNPFLWSVSATDVLHPDFFQIGDAVLALEYETKPGSS